jgi:hypothetical protein
MHRGVGFQLQEAFVIVLDLAEHLCGFDRVFGNVVVVDLVVDAQGRLLREENVCRFAAVGFGEALLN